MQTTFTPEQLSTPRIAEANTILPVSGLARTVTQKRFLPQAGFATANFTVENMSGDAGPDVVTCEDAIFTITQGGPGTATTNLPYEIYLTMFRKYEYGEAAAAGVVVVVGTIVVATFALRTISSLFREESAR